MEERVKFTVGKKDFEYQWFSGTGAGGQKRNKSQNCFRLIHPATGVIKTGTKHVSRESNKRDALSAMSKDVKFLAYCESKLREIENGITLEEQVEESLKEENLKIEVKTDTGKWKTVNSSELLS